MIDVLQKRVFVREMILWCNDYFRPFKGKNCFESHTYKEENDYPVYEMLWNSLKYKRIINKINRKPGDHKWGERQCKNWRQ